MTRILITGVRGKTGVPLAELLKRRPGVEVLGGSSDPSRVQAEGVRPIALSWDAPDGWPTATDAVDAVFVVRPDRPDAPELIEAFVAQTPAHTHVVLLSERDDGWFTPTSWATRTERAVVDGGRSWTVLRPSWFMQVLNDERFLRTQIAKGELPFPAGGADVAWIDARDIAAVAEHALLDRRHSEQRYELSGPQALSLPQTAQLLSEALGRTIGHVETTVDEAVADLDGFERELTLTTYERVQAGAFAGVTDTVAHVTGRPARTLQQFARDHWPIDAGRAPAR